MAKSVHTIDSAVFKINNIIPIGKITNFDPVSKILGIDHNSIEDRLNAKEAAEKAAADAAKPGAPLKLKTVEKLEANRDRRTSIARGASIALANEDKQTLGARSSRLGGTTSSSERAVSGT